MKLRRSTTALIISLTAMVLSGILACGYVVNGSMAYYHYPPGQEREEAMQRGENTAKAWAVVFVVSTVTAIVSFVVWIYNRKRNHQKNESSSPM